MEVFAGRFALVRRIGGGAGGEVWLVHDRAEGPGGPAYAAKVLRRSNATALQRFVREQGRRIDHPHVVTPIAEAEDRDRALFTMPLIRGGSLATLVGDHGPLPAGWVALLLGQALDGLAALHAAGVVHRDLTPSNLLLDATGTARPHLRISDFGVAARIGEARLTSISRAVGTPGYLAPEQREGADPDPAMDLYTLAMTGLTLLTGAPAPAAVGEARDLHGPEGTLAEALRPALAADPRQRPGVAGLRRAIRRAAARTPTPGTPGDTSGVVVLTQIEEPGAAQPQGL